MLKALCPNQYKHVHVLFRLLIFTQSHNLSKRQMTRLNQKLSFVSHSKDIARKDAAWLLIKSEKVTMDSGM